MATLDPLLLTEGKKKIMAAMDHIAAKRDRYVKRNRYYYKDIIKFLKFNIPEGSTVLEVGCGTGYLLNALNPAQGVGIDISEKMIQNAAENYNEKNPALRFLHMDAENLQLDETFDFIVLSDTLGYFEDIERAFKELKKVSHPGTRIIVTYHSFLWQPFMKMAEWFRLKMPQNKLNWLNKGDILNLMALEGYDVIKQGRRFLFPKFFPLLSWLFNKYLAHLPLLNRLCITGYIVARPQLWAEADNKKYSVSVVIPARNEEGNIENAVKRMPQLGNHTEIIFVEGHSSDNTLDEIKRVCEKYKDQWDLKYTVQDGKGKGDAVRKGYGMANGDILMILDGDLTVPPEDLPKFYNAIATGKGEYINGSRLVYPMEKQAMRMLNVLGNKFFSIMFSWLLSQPLKDTLCGTKVITRENWEKLVANRKYFGDFDPFGDFDLIFGSAKMNLKIIEVPIRYRAREYGDTNISRFSHGWLLLKMVFFAMNKIKFI
jgi:ubiquinone/menaquinone biosynthesis C-methylase UbiE